MTRISRIRAPRASLFAAALLAVAMAAFGLLASERSADPGIATAPAAPAAADSRSAAAVPVPPRTVWWWGWQ